MLEVLNDIKSTLEVEALVDEQYSKTSQTYTFTESHFQ